MLPLKGALPTGLTARFVLALFVAGLPVLLFGCSMSDSSDSSDHRAADHQVVAPGDASADLPLALTNRDIGSPFEKFALIVDDSRFPTRPPGDAEHDQFIRENVAARFFELGDVDEIPIYLPAGVAEEAGSARIFDLEYLLQYQYVLWHVNNTWTHMTALYANETERGLLTSYLNAGGRLFLIGDRISSNLVSRSGTFVYPKPHPDDPNQDPAFSKDSFIWRKMLMRNEIVSVPTSANAYFQEASHLIGATSRHRSYPDLALDRSKTDPLEVIHDGARYRAGIDNWEAVLNSYEPQFYPGLVPLYDADVFDNTLDLGPYETGYDRAVLAHRYQWRSTGSERQPRLVVFGFQPWWFEAESLREAAGSAINWLVSGAEDAR